jgi:hypothetical protein
MLCPNCQSEIQDNSLFCAYCGKKVTVNETTLLKSVAEPIHQNSEKETLERTVMIRNVVLVSLAFVGSIIAAGLIAYFTAGGSWQLYCTFGTGIITLLAIMLNLFDSKCPNCNALAAGVEMSSKEIGSQTGYKTIEREEKNSRGEVIRTWKEQIRVKTVASRHHYTCEVCFHEWSKRTSQDYDTFHD